MNSPLLLLCHRIPFPPDKGDKIRSYHLLRELARKHAVVLGAFVDDVSDWKYRDELESICEEVYLEGLSPRLAKVRSLKGIFQGEALSIPYYYNKNFFSWVESAIKKYRPDNIVVYSSPMAQYVMSESYSDINRVMDFVDVDSDKWKQYAESQSWPNSWLYRREAKNLLNFEERVAAAFDYSFFVSEAEAELFNSMLPRLPRPASYFNNGVDTNYFSPDSDFSSEQIGCALKLVFTGAMDYWPNVEAVVWFAREVLPVLRDHWPELEFVIVGSKPAEAVQKLADMDGVVVTGRVADVRPYIHDAWAVVAPLRIARGIQNKVLEGMAMAKPVIATEAALEGIVATDGVDLLVANDARSYEMQLRRLANEEYAHSIGQAARERVIKDYAWDGSLRPLLKALR